MPAAGDRDVHQLPPGHRHRGVPAGFGCTERPYPTAAAAGCQEYACPYPVPLNRLLAGEMDYAALRPDVWKQSHPEAIRIYRQEERRSRAVAKAVKRARRRIANRG